MPPARRTTKKTATTAARSATAKAALEGKVLPAGKTPQDRRPKAEPEPTVVTVTVRDVEWTVPTEALDDFELLDDLNALDQHGDGTRLPAVMRRFLGDDQFAKAMKLLRDPSTGRVTVETGTVFFWDLMEALNPNSSSSSD